MVKKIAILVWQFLADFWYIYLMYLSIFALLFWSATMRSLNLSIVIDTFFGSCYILSIITSILFWKWYREDKKLSVLLIEKNMVSMPEIKAMTSHEKKYQTLIKKQQSAQEVLQYKLNENIQDMQDYYAMWAHQIKVPLSVLDLMNQTGTVDKYETGNQLLVINQYLDMMLQFIRLKNFNQDLTYQKISIQATLRSVIKDYKYWFIHKNLSICLNENDFIVVSDPKWLHFVFEQIIFNAIKYTPNGKINIICEENGRVIIQDTGIGIASSDLPLIFNQGYTGFNGRINSNSSGLGLYMVKTILNSLGHDIQISSQINVGTKVIIDFEQTEIK